MGARCSKRFLPRINLPEQVVRSPCRSRRLPKNRMTCGSLKPESRLESPQRLGKNINGYFGERIEIPAVLADCVAAGHAHGWSIEEISVAPKSSLFALTRKATRAAHHASRIYISAGIHGDEPAGPLAARQLLQENQWPADVSIWLLPCLNPTGFL